MNTKWMTPQSFKVKNREVPTVPEPVVRDEIKKGPPNSIATPMDNTVPLTTHHVQPDVLNDNTAELYTMSADSDETKTLPFIHAVGLKSETGTLMNIKGLFDDGVMVNLLCKSMYKLLENNLGKLTTSWHQLQMANGTVVPSIGKWTGNVQVGSQVVKSSFEVFCYDSHGTQILFFSFTCLLHSDSFLSRL